LLSGPALGAVSHSTGDGWVLCALRTEHLEDYDPLSDLDWSIELRFYIPVDTE